MTNVQRIQLERRAVQAAVNVLTNALSEAAHDYACAGQHDSMVVCNAFDHLRKILKDKAQAL